MGTASDNVAIKSELVVTRSNPCRTSGTYGTLDQHIGGSRQWGTSHMNFALKTTSRNLLTNNQLISSLPSNVVIDYCSLALGIGATHRKQRTGALALAMVEPNRNCA